MSPWRNLIAAKVLSPAFYGESMALNHSSASPQFDYMSWGTWSGNMTSQSGFSPPHTMSSGFFIVGSETKTINMPQSGTATYTGAIRGQYTESGTTHNDLRGTVNLTANFNTSRIGGGFTFKRGDETNLLTAQMPSSTSSISNNRFSGTITPIGTGGGGGVQGRFYGPQGQEIGGNVVVYTDSGVNVSGVFGAKK
jgi:hypothetical protein